MIVEISVLLIAAAACATVYLIGVFFSDMAQETSEAIEESENEGQPSPTAKEVKK